MCQLGLVFHVLPVGEEEQSQGLHDHVAELATNRQTRGKRYELQQ